VSTCRISLKQLRPDFGDILKKESGFLQVRENWRSQGICVVMERSEENIIFEKSGQMMLDHAECRYL